MKPVRCQEDLEDSFIYGLAPRAGCPHLSGVRERIPPNPAQLFRLFESGRLSIEDLRAAMQVHARLLIVEMVEARRNPISTALEHVRNRAAAARLARQHGEDAIREALAALAEVDDFPPSRWVWNAAHRDVPLHCFVRSRHEPVFRIVEFLADPMVVRLAVEHGPTAAVVREQFVLRRGRNGRLGVESRRRSG